MKTLSLNGRTIREVLKYTLVVMSGLVLASSAQARTVHTGSDPGVAIFLSIAATVVFSIVATIVVRTLRK